MASIKIEGIDFEVKSKGSPFIPAKNDAYLWHPHTYDILKDIQENRCVLLTGHAGTGKSSLPQQIAARINQQCVRPVLNGQMTVSDFIGYNTVKNGELVWVDGILTTAMRQGQWIILDEIDFADPYILSALNTVTEPINPSNPQRILVLKENGGEVIIAHPDFRIFATANTVGIMEEFRHLYRGANLMNIAFLDRWRVYHCDYLKEKDEIKVLIDTLPRITEELANYLVRIALLVREAFQKQQVSQPFSLRRLFDWSSMIVRYLDRYKAEGKLNKDTVKRIPLQAAEATLFSRVTVEERKVLEGIMSRVLPN